MRPSTKRRRTKPCRESPGRPAACPSSSRAFSPSWSHATNAVPILAHGPHPPAHCCHRALALSRGTLACALSVGTLFSLASCHVAGIKIFAKNACDRDPGRAGVLVCTTANHRTGRTGWIGRLKQRLRLPSVPEAGGLRPELRVSSLVPWFTDGRLLPLSSRGLSLHACARIPHLRRAPAMVDKGPPDDPI